MPWRLACVLCVIAMLPGARAAGAPRVQVTEARAAYGWPCPPSGDVVAVFTRTRELYLCRGGATEARIPVALGRGGVDKRRTGDDRTPLGTYALGEPRTSQRFGTFIPIAYPTADQIAQGFTGSSIGIHGPPRDWSDRSLATAFDWTRGCIATGSDTDVERIARFTRERRPLAIIR